MEARDISGNQNNFQLRCGTLSKVRASPWTCSSRPENAKNYHSLTVAASEASVPARRVLPGRQRRIHHVSKLLRIRRPGVHIDGSLSAEERAQHLNLG